MPSSEPSASIGSRDGSPNPRIPSGPTGDGRVDTWPHLTFHFRIPAITLTGHTVNIKGFAHLVVMQVRRYQSSSTAGLVCPCIRMHQCHSYSRLAHLFGISDLGAT